MEKLKFILEIIKPFKKWIFCIIFVHFLIAFDLAFRPYVIKIILDKLQSANTSNVVELLTTPLLILICLSLMIAVIYRLFDYAWLKLNPGIKRHAGEILMQRMLQHSHQLYQDNFAGELASKIKEIMSGIPDLIKLIADVFLINIIALPLSIYVISKIHSDLGIMLAVWLVIFIILSFKLASGVKPYAIESSSAKNKVMGAIVDILSNMMSVRLFAASKTENKYLKNFLNNYYIADQKRDWFVLKMFFLLSFSFVIFEACAFYWLVNAFKKNMVTAGDFALVISMSMALIERLWYLSNLVGRISDLIGNFSPPDINWQDYCNRVTSSVKKEDKDEDINRRSSTCCVCY